MMSFVSRRENVYVVFIDFTKAFDQVNHHKNIEILRESGINGSALRITVNLYLNQKAFMKNDETLANEIYIKRGVRQG